MLNPSNAGKIIINMQQINTDELLENMPDDEEEKEVSFTKNLFFENQKNMSINETHLKAVAIDHVPKD